jgi:hypothetical protein
METGSQDEFYASLIIIGGLVFSSSLVVIVLATFAIKLYRKTKKSKITREIYEQTKERKNGRH